MKHLKNLRLTRLGKDEPAGLWITSLPWPCLRRSAAGRPRAVPQNLSLDSQPTHLQPLGQWPGKSQPHPRRLLMIADGANRAPRRIALTTAGKRAAGSAKPTAAMELFEHSPHLEYMWERHRLRIRMACHGRGAAPGRMGERSVGLAMGLRTGGKVHWWEACHLIALRETAECLVIEMGGAIPRHHMTFDELKKYPGYTNPWLHKHNWLNGHIYARLHANGVCEIYARHINSKFFDDGLPLDDVVPVIGISVDPHQEDLVKLCGPWDGSCDRMTLGGVRFDVSEAARLATASQPGRISQEGDFLVWQPYQGVDVFGGVCPKDLTGDPFIFHAGKGVFPRGMSRTIRFSLSLSDRSPRIARYLAPAWWYGVCEEFLPEALLPVSNEYDASLDAGRKWIRNSTVQCGFEDGSVSRYHYTKQDKVNRSRNEPGWEGEVPYAQFLTAWRTGAAEEFAAALRSAYHFTDVCVDHSAKLVRMHGYPSGAFALPMNRMQGTIAAFLETGDPFLLDIAQAVTANAYWQHKNSWPRLAVGRDACFVRSAVLLYRYLGDEFFRNIAHAGALSVVQSQRPNGSFGDQGGGTGLHQWGGYITKPWMGLLALNGVLDYLELFPEEQPFQQAVRKFADWLMAARLEIDGVMTWTYQHDYNGAHKSYDPYGARWVELPTQGRWHQENLGRLLGHCALRYNEPKYLDAWAASYRGKGGTESDHSMSAALQFIPWVQAKLWQARLNEKRIQIRPFHFGPRTPSVARILTPDGNVAVKWTPKGKVKSGCEWITTDRGFA